MTPFYLIFALLLQGVLISCENDTEAECINEDKIIDMYSTGPRDFIDLFFGSGKFEGPSASMMSQVTADSDKTPDEQVEDIKEIANKICSSIQSEMADLLAYAMAGIDKIDEDKPDRKRRNVESPMDSTKLIMRLLQHIKSNNENQNVVIEKMMSAQQIADKFGVAFNPDIEMLTDLDLDLAASEQAKELQSILSGGTQESENLPTTEDFEFIPVESSHNEAVVELDKPEDNNGYYHYDIHEPGITVTVEHIPKRDTSEHINDYDHYPPNHVQYIDVPQQRLNPIPQAHYNIHPQPQFETQMMPPMQQHHHQQQHQHNHHHHQQQHHCQPVCQRPPVFYEPQMSYKPEFCLPAPELSTSFSECEPELVGEEYEETVSSKVTVDKGDEPGAATVNHVMTYTLSEKAHFKKPEINSLPEQLQYYFYLI